jgi:hypothetical protein
MNDGTSRVEMIVEMRGLFAFFHFSVGETFSLL